MEIIVNNNKIVNYDALTDRIRECEDIDRLVDLLNELSSLITKRSIDSADAQKLLVETNSRIQTLNNAKLAKNNTKEKGKRLSLSVFKDSELYNHQGIVTAVLLVGNIAITTIMYALLFLSKVITK